MLYEKKEKNSLKLFLMISVLGLAYFFSNFHRLSLGVVSDVIQTDFGLTTTQLGLLGSALFYPYAVMQLPSGMIADKVATNKLITFSCVLTALSTILFSTAKSFPILVVARMMAGVGTALVYVPALAAIRRQFGDTIFGTMTGIMVSMGQLGAVCASAPLKFLTHFFGWRKSFFVIGVITVVLSIACWFLIVDPKEPSTRNAPKQSAWKMVLQPFAISIILWFFMTGGSRLSFQSLWGGRFFTEALAMSPEKSSLMLMCISIGCIVGASILGSISDKIGSVSTVILSTVIFSLTWVVYAFCKQNTNTILIGITGIVLGAVGAGGFTVGFSCIRLFASKEYTGTVTGIVNFFTFIGSAVFTQICGNFMEILPIDGKLMQFRVLLLCFTVTALITTFFVWIANRKQNLTKN